MRMQLIISVLVTLGACEYRETIGRSDKDNQADASTPGVPDSRPPTGSCLGFVIPSGDCTLGLGDCSFQSDCEGANMNCNLSTHRCYRSTESCVGTPCTFDPDCPSAERCNQATNTCYDLSADQSCMPCFLSDSDCGLQKCESMTCS